MIRLLKYVFWILRYLFSGPDKDLGACMNRLDRTRWPWRKFQPGVWRNDVGRFWDIYLSDEQDYTDTGWNVRVDLCIGMDTGEIVGMKISDRVLKRLAAEVSEVRGSTKGAIMPPEQKPVMIDGDSCPVCGFEGGHYPDCHAADEILKG